LLLLTPLSIAQLPGSSYLKDLHRQKGVLKEILRRTVLQVSQELTWAVASRIVIQLKAAHPVHLKWGGKGNSNGDGNP